MIYLDNPDFYSDKQKETLSNAININVDVSDMKNPWMPNHIMEAYIELRQYGYEIEFLEDHGLGGLSLTYLDCLRTLARNGINIYQLIYDNHFIKYTNRQILTITDGLLEGFSLRLFGKVEYSNSEMRNIIENLKLSKEM